MMRAAYGRDDNMIMSRSSRRSKEVKVPVKVSPHDTHWIDNAPSWYDHDKLNRVRSMLNLALVKMNYEYADGKLDSDVDALIKESMVEVHRDNDLLLHGPESFARLFNGAVGVWVQTRGQRAIDWQAGALQEEAGVR